MGKDCCETCRFSHYDMMLGYVCVNDKGEYRTDYVDGDFGCDDWEEKPEGEEK